VQLDRCFDDPSVRGRLMVRPAFEVIRPLGWPQWM